MAIDERELADRLRQARVASSLSQDQVAERTGLSRSAVTQIENGKRGVGSIELSRLAESYGRTVSDFLGEQFDPEGALLTLFRASGEPMKDQVTVDALRRYAGLARQLTSLEGLFGINVGAGSSFKYSFPHPKNKFHAMQQGKMVADQERRRLGLGLASIADVPALITDQGVRVATVDLPDSVSGMTVVDPQTGPLVIVNGSQSRVRRRFSLAHEYCHVLLDRDGRGQISLEDSGDLIEIRANAFAASFLMPEDGAYRFLDTLGKSAQNQIGTESPVGAESAASVTSRQVDGRAIQLNDVAMLANQFDVSRSMVLHRLRNLRVLSPKAFEELQADEKARGAKIGRLLGLPVVPDDSHKDRFCPRLLNLALDAFYAGEISRSKLDEIYQSALGRSVEEGELDVAREQD